MDYLFIDQFDLLSQAASEWNQLKEIAIDIECENNLHHFGAYISLIQLSSRTKNWVIDALLIKDLSPFVKLLENKNIQKVIHDVSFDLRILNKISKTVNIYDTQLAALFLGKENLGLKSLLEDYFSIHKQKKFQRVDWTKRPLSKEMLAYAVMDSAYLLQLKDKLNNELKVLGRLSWVEEECSLLEKMDYTYHEQTYLDVTGAKSLLPKKLGRFKILFEERQRLAKLMDKPPFMIMRNSLLLEFAKKSPDWKHVRGVHPIIREQAKNISELLASAKEEVIIRNIAKRFSLDQQNKVKQLTELRMKESEKISIKPYLLLSQDEIKDIVLTKKINSLNQWQKELLGSKVEKIIN
jgi:ribonuclease D